MGNQLIGQIEAEIGELHARGIPVEVGRNGL
jgi:hypothetical protein